MSKLMELPDVKINTSRSGFDVSQKVCFSAKAGEMLPVWTREVIPSESFEIDLQSFSRSQPMNTSAYTRCREYYDFYFVPYTQLWKQWRMFATQMQDNNIYAKDVNSSQTIGEYHPFFTNEQVANYIFSHSTYKDVLGYDKAPKMCKLLEYLGYGDFTPYITRPFKGYDYDEYDKTGADYNKLDPIITPLNPFPLLAYQKIYNDKVRDPQWEKSQPYTFNLDYMQGESMVAIPVESMTTENSMFDLRYFNWNKDYYFGLLPNSQYGKPAVVPLFDSTQLSSVTGNQTVPFAFNFGSFKPTTGDTNFDFTVDNLVSQLTKDAAGNYTGNLKGRLLDHTGYPTGDQPAANRIDLIGMNSGLSEALRNSFSDLSILALRQYEMLQRYREVQQSAPTDYKSQIEKLFGVSLDWHDSDEVRWLGGISRNYEFSEIVNTNLDRSNENSEASIFGKGVSVADGKIHFESKGEYGIIMCIYHVMPLLDYSLDTPLKLNTKCAFSDYAQPAFDRIGLQAIPALELFNTPQLLMRLVQAKWTDDEIKSGILGYGPRYLDYKTAIDRVVGVFRTTEKRWVAPLDTSFLYNLYDLTNDPSSHVNQFPYSDTLLDYTSFKVNPAILDPIFGFEAESTVDSDQFLVNCFIGCSDVKNLDYDGMPY